VSGIPPIPSVGSAGNVLGISTSDMALSPTDTSGIQAGAAASSGSGSFSSMLTNAIGGLNDQQLQAASQSQALATGHATDVSAVVSQVEQAALSMQLAVQIRNQAVNGYQELMRMQL
jgi:flagellar hook-basal body complex protein FliE